MAEQITIKTPKEKRHTTHLQWLEGAFENLTRSRKAGRSHLQATQERRTLLQTHKNECTYNKTTELEEEMILEEQRIELEEEEIEWKEKISKQTKVTNKATTIFLLIQRNEMRLYPRNLSRAHVGCRTTPCIHMVVPNMKRVNKHLLRR